MTLQISDRYGSPSMDEVELFARAYNRGLEAALGEEEAGAVTVEVSSPVSTKSQLSCLYKPIR